MLRKYHIALSFAGEDRGYVEEVAEALQAVGVDVFYDKFEEHELWGKDLYAHLSDIYQNRAMFTVMFVSNAYSIKLWTSHERKSAQARAFSESREYILPAFFDTAVEVPGLLKTTGYIDLAARTPAELADLIVRKLTATGVRLHESFSYASDAKADADFPLRRGELVSDLILAMKSCTWPTQHPAVDATLKLDWNTVSADEAFLLGRNIYQCTDGNERRAVSCLDRLRPELAKINPSERALDFLNGMLFEVYFDASGNFRGKRIKKRCLEKLLAIQTVEKCAPSIGFIQRALEPYRDRLPFIPSTSPQKVVVQLEVDQTAPPTIRSLKVGDRNLLEKDLEGNGADGRLWRLSFKAISTAELEAELADAWAVPKSLLSVQVGPTAEPYGIHTFDWTADRAARANPAAMAANCAHPARMVLGPGGL